MWRGRFSWSASFLECLIWSWAWMTRLVLKKSHNLNPVLLKGSFHIHVFSLITFLPSSNIFFWYNCFKVVSIFSFLHIPENNALHWYFSPVSLFIYIFWMSFFFAVVGVYLIILLCSLTSFSNFNVSSPFINQITFAVVKLLSLTMSLSINV